MLKLRTLILRGEHSEFCQCTESDSQDTPPYASKTARRCKPDLFVHTVNIIQP